VAQYADACNLWESVIEHKLAVLRQRCEEVGRNFEDITVTTTGRLDPGDSVDALVERFGRLAELGVDMPMVDAPVPFGPAAELLAEVIPQVADLGRPAPAILDGAPGGVTLAGA